MPEYYIRIVRETYRGEQTKLKNGVRISMSFLFLTLMNDILKDKMAKAAQCMLFADDIVLVWESVEELSANLGALTKVIKKK